MTEVTENEIEAVPRRASSRGHRIVLVVASLALAAGLMLPILIVETLTGDDSSSILSGLVVLIEEELFGLAIVIFVFSIVFPIAKLTVLSRIVGRDGDHEVALARLALTGKWSMLDVCVVIVFASAIQLGLLAEARTGPGILAFSAAVILTMLLTGNLRRRLPEPAEPPPGRGSKLEIGFAFLALAALVVGLLIPLMEVEKWAFWSNRASIMASLIQMIEDGTFVPAILIGVFVVALPLAATLETVAARLRRSSTRAQHHRLELLDEWALHDVYALALILFWFKARESASIELLPGFYCMLVSAVATIAGRILVARRHSSSPMPNEVPGSSGG